MGQLPPIEANGPRRRSTRVDQAIPLVITWRDLDGQTLREETATLSINCHGCRFFSRHRLGKNTKITVRAVVPGANSTPEEQGISARVAWTQKSRRLAGMYQVGVEFESPQDLWHIEEFPEDWNAFFSAAREDTASFLAEIEKLLQWGQAGMYPELLGVRTDTPRVEIRRKFYRMARRFHPDRHMDRPEWTPRLLQLMESLNVAYKFLTEGGYRKAQESASKDSSLAYNDGHQELSREYLRHAEQCLAAKNYAGSILWLRRAIEAEPQSSHYRALLGHSLAAVPEYRHEAVEQFEIALDLDSLNVDAHFQYAQLLERLNFSWRARTHYARILELDAFHAQARERLSQIDVKSPRSVSRTSLLWRRRPTVTP